jgi:ABC-2 type transport system ATP-binding protein
MPQAVEIRNLVKEYGSFRAVDGISLTVNEGDFFGFLGPNGAGKTTTINAVVGLARFDGGSISLFGHDAKSDWRAARRLVGLAPQEFNFDRYLSIREILIYQAGYYGLRPREVRARADELLERFGLGAKAHVEQTKLSGGMKRRLTLARALIHRPKLLILDEPTAGVDVELRFELWDLLRELNRDGTTIFLTTHYLEEAESLCRTVAIIEGGKIAALAPTAELIARSGGMKLRVTIRDRHAAVPRVVELDGLRPDEIGAKLLEIGIDDRMIEDVEVTRTSLQDVFLELVGR